MTEYSGEEVAELVGDDLAARFALDDGPYTDADLDALTDALAESAELADDVADGDVAALATLLSPDFLDAHSEFESFAAFLDASPWHRDDVEAAFAGRTDGDDGDPAAATTSSFLTRTTSFRTPGEMVQAAVVYRCRSALEASSERDGDDGET
ncbi:hypothetical protein G9C85_10440 [Halorubellus sp. JP-L1]|uniref:hypothetical protein n=1 Tax=Halorubellus sp. JP-L1 TaxID=2715753 RepID=UPI001408A133|nr:hypothetical protein [Halorubellus sp. JP-L1]NHN42044.1 hypothetical protein [Halorubellus sp. JP-L1]